MQSFGHADHPLTDPRNDRLGLAPYAESLAEFIRRCDTPLTVAIQGDWGTGKTSLMHMVQAALRGGPNGGAIRPIWFNTWQYSQFATHASLPASLLSSLLRQISGPDDTVVKASIRVLGRLMKPAANAALRVGTAGALEIGDFASNAGSFQSDPAADADELKADIKRVIAEKRDQGVERFVVFIDDLDRILPERAVEILEVIKLFLDWEGCVFVLALDYAVVSRGLNQRFHTTEQDLGGRSFFDKIIQLPFTVPVARYDVRVYMEGLLQGMSLPTLADDYEIFGRLVRHSVSVNPRGIKRVLNSLQLLVLVAKAQGLVTGSDAVSDRLVIRNLFALLCLQMGFEDVYDWLAERALEVDETHLTGLLAEEGSRDADLEGALSKLTPERRQDFDGFARAFSVCIQTPEHDLAAFDAAELERLRQTLTLTRITAVTATTERAAAETPDEASFRWKNRRFMEKVGMEIERRLPPDSKGQPNKLQLYQPHSDAAVDLYRTLRHPDAVKLQIRHSLNACRVYITGVQYAIRSARKRLEETEWTRSVEYHVNDYEIVFLERELDSAMSFSERENLLLGSVADLYVEVTSFFNR